MRIGAPVNQRYYKPNYDPLRGRESLNYDRGFFINSLRAVGLGKLAHDKENGLLINHHITQYYDGAGLINDFISLGESSQPSFFNNDKQQKFLRLGLKNFRVNKKNVGDQFKYRIAIPVGRHETSQRELRLYAKNDDDALNKLEWIFKKPVARAKLVYKVNKIIPFVKGYVFFDENRIVGGLNKIQNFYSRNTSQEAETYESAMGSSDSKQINYYSPSVLNVGRYSDKQEASVDLQDQLWFRIHARSRTISDCNDIDELLGSIYNMYSENDNNPEVRAQTVRYLREDFMYNLFGDPNKVMRQVDHFPDSLRTTHLGKSALSHIQLGSNPLKGGRFWKSSPCDLKDTIQHLYYTKGDGNIGFKYDMNPEKFLKIIRKKFIINSSDRQYMGGFSRKILGAHTVLDFLREELNNTHISKTLSPQQKRQKFKDLSELSDDIFESIGDMRDNFRNDFSGFSQFTHALCNKNSLKPFNLKTNHVLHGDNYQPQHSDFGSFLADSFKDVTENYVYMNMLLHNELRTSIGDNLYRSLKRESFGADKTDIIAATGGIMALQGLEKTSTYLRNLLGGMEYHTNFHGAFGYLLNSAKNGDEKAVKSAITLLNNKMCHISQGELLKRGVKYRTLLSEAVFHVRHSPPTKLETYTTDNREKDAHNQTTTAYRLAEVNSEIMTHKILDSMKYFSGYMDKIKQEMNRTKETNPYQTKTMSELNDHMRKASEKMALHFVKKHRHIWGDSNKDVMKTVYKHLTKTYFSYFQLLANSTAMVRDNPEIVYTNSGKKSSYLTVNSRER